MLKKIISGGQTGADYGGLVAGKYLKLETGGWAPRGYRTENGSNLKLKEFGLVEAASPDYVPRTQMNANFSDGTIWFGKVSPGYSTTKKACQRFGKPFIDSKDVETKELFLAWLEKHQISTLNVAGNRESTNKGLQKYVTNWLIQRLSE